MLSNYLLPGAKIMTENTTVNIETEKDHTMIPVKKQAKDLVWSNVNFSVGEKSILKDCWGEVKVGQIAALLGPSGAGKSSMLNVLAGRSASGSGAIISGTIKVGGKEINPVQFRKNIAYVMQDDCLLATTTPREAFQFSATLRLPSSMTSMEINDRVDKLLEDLGLLECADVYIGNAVIKGVSGGQRKRTSVGVEIITEPTLLFLDEPTTGLDSFSAFNLIKLLNKISANCAILCTIHQPSSDIFFLFDKAIFMKDGRIFYQGPTSEIEHYFELRGYPCPEQHNPSDFIMNLCQSSSSEDLSTQKLMMEIPEEYSSQRQSTKKYELDSMQFSFESSFLKQVSTIVYRGVLDLIRDIPSIINRLLLNIVLGLLFGCIFMNIGHGDNGDMSIFNSHVGAISMIMIISMYYTAHFGLLSFPLERPMILREYVTGTYDIAAYFVGKTLIEVPYNFVLLLMFYGLLYFLIDLQGDFLSFVFISWALALSCNSLALVLGVMISSITSVTELASLIFIPQLLFAGFYIRTEQIPEILRWAQYLCQAKYGMNLALYTEFRASLPSCQTSDLAAMNCAGVLESNNIHSKDIGLYIGSLLILFVGYRIIAVLILYQKAKKFY